MSVMKNTMATNLVDFRIRLLKNKQLCVMIYMLFYILSKVSIYGKAQEGSNEGQLRKTMASHEKEQDEEK